MILHNGPLGLNYSGTFSHVRSIETPTQASGFSETLLMTASLWTQSCAKQKETLGNAPLCTAKMAIHCDFKI